MTDNHLFATFWMCLAFVLITVITNLNINSIVHMKIDPDKKPLIPTEVTKNG